MARFVPKVTPGRKLHSQARELIWRVSEFMAKEANEDNDRIPTNKSLERTAAACGVSIRTIKKIRNEKKNMVTSPDPECSFVTPKKKTRLKNVTEMDDFNKSVVRRTVYNFYKTDKSLPTLTLLKNKLLEAINFRGSVSSLRKILVSMGFKWKKIENNRKILIERDDIRAKRINYLRAIRKARAEEKPVVYMDESYVLSSHVTKKGWCDDSLQGYKTNISKGQRAIIVHAGGEMGFIPNAELIWKAGTTEGDYHDQMNHENFVTWTKNQLIPNLPPNSLVVVDNAPYHNVQVDKAPNSSSRKADMVKWLAEKTIPHDKNMLKPELYRIIKLYKEQHKVFVLDKLLEENGHSVLRLPPYHPDLNPIENIWGIVKNLLALKNVTNKLQDTIILCKEKMNAITKEEWVKVCKKVIATEEDYYQKEHLIDETTERFIITLNASSDESGDDEDIDSSSSEDEEGTPLATPL